MTQPNILEIAKQGDAKAIALLLNRQLQAKGITAAASLKDGCLQVMLESAEAPSQQVLAPWVSKSIAGLGAVSIEKVKVYGRQTGAKVPAWSQEFEMAGQNLPVANVTQAQASSSDNTESNQLSLKERAKLGDVEALASLLNIPLQNKGISATASLQDGCLQVMLEGDRVPDEEVSIRIVRRELTNLKAGAIASVKVYGQQVGEDFPVWNREFEIAQVQLTSSPAKLSVNNQASGFKAKIPDKNTPKQLAQSALNFLQTTLLSHPIISKLYEQSLVFIKDNKYIIKNKKTMTIAIIFIAVVIVSGIFLNKDAKFQREVYASFDSYPKKSQQEGYKKMFEAYTFERAKQYGIEYCSDLSKGMSEEELFRAYNDRQLNRYMKSLENGTMSERENIDLFVVEREIQGAAIKVYCPQFLNVIDKVPLQKRLDATDK
ncbi:hypothetical protein [Microcoleus sp. S13_C5]|uniref:hypothetical protein n=1 Tax=Microcoleus sp. S13_C5 TaxID=3055411 RepID=UPI002FCE9C9B